jgi:hypothetical protein
MYSFWNDYHDEVNQSIYHHLWLTFLCLWWQYLRSIHLANFNLLNTQEVCLCHHYVHSTCIWKFVPFDWHLSVSRVGFSYRLGLSIPFEYCTNEVVSHVCSNKSGILLNAHDSEQFLLLTIWLLGASFLYASAFVTMCNAFVCSNGEREHKCNNSKVLILSLMEICTKLFFTSEQIQF